MKTALPILLVLSACAFIVNAHPHIDDGSPLSMLPMLFGGGGVGGASGGDHGSARRGFCPITAFCTYTVSYWKSRGPPFLASLQDSAVIEYCKMGFKYNVPMSTLTAEYETWAQTNNVESQYTAYAVKVRNQCTDAAASAKMIISGIARSAEGTLTAAASFTTTVSDIKSNPTLTMKERFVQSYRLFTANPLPGAISIATYGYARIAPSQPRTIPGDQPVTFKP